MNLESLKTTFKTVILKWIVSQIDANTIRTLFEGTLTKLKSKTESTETPIDDALAAGLEYIIESDHLDAMAEWLRAYLTKDAGVCEAAGADEIEALAKEICRQPDGVCESSTIVSVVVQVLQAVLPLILSYLTEKAETETTKTPE